MYCREKNRFCKNKCSLNIKIEIYKQGEKGSKNVQSILTKINSLSQDQNNILQNLIKEKKIITCLTFEIKTKMEKNIYH